MNKVTTIERGWPGHFICANLCLFRRNTLIECRTKNNGEICIVVSTVGLMQNSFYNREPATDKFEKIGVDAYYETMAFHSKKGDTRYHDADVSRPVHFDLPDQVTELDADDKANTLHDAIVAELVEKLKRGQQL